MKKKKTKLHLRPFYDDTYKEVETFFASSCYKEGLDLVSKHFEKHGLPLPDEPIERDECLSKPGPWSAENFKKYEETSRSEKLLSDLKQLEKEYKEGKINRKTFGDLRDGYETSEVLFPVGEYIGYILNRCLNITGSRDKKKGDLFYNEVLDRIFHGKEEYIPPFSTYFKRNSSDEKVGLYIKILASTKRDDIVKNGNFIKRSQERLNGYKESLRKNNPFDRKDMLKKTEGDDEDGFFINILPIVRKKHIVENGSFIQERQRTSNGYQKNYKTIKNLKRDTYIKELYKDILEKNNFKTKKEIGAIISNKLEDEKYDKIFARRIQKIAEEG